MEEYAEPMAELMKLSRNNTSTFAGLEGCKAYCPLPTLSPLSGGS